MELIPTLAPICMKKHPKSMISGVFLVAGVGFEPHGLRVMSPTSYQAALPRDIKLRLGVPPHFITLRVIAARRRRRIVVFFASQARLKTPCFVRYHFAKTILNRFCSFTQRATKLLYPAILFSAENFACSLTALEYYII